MEGKIQLIAECFSHLSAILLCGAADVESEYPIPLFIEEHTGRSLRDDYEFGLRELAVVPSDRETVSVLIAFESRTTLRPR